jgi:hypothetical protein
MKSTRAEALRLILPLLLRGATVDFFGTDDFRDRVVVGLDDELRDRVDDEDRRVEGDRPPFCVVTCNGHRRAGAIKATPMRLSITNPPVPLGLSSVQRAEVSSNRA